MKTVIIILILLGALLLVIGLQSQVKIHDNEYFKSYINTNIIGGYVD